eukprot:408341-Rhodomonas_salina.1
MALLYAPTLSGTDGGVRGSGPLILNVYATRRIRSRGIEKSVASALGNTKYALWSYARTARYPVLTLKCGA